MVKSVSSVDIKSKGAAKKSKIVKKIKQAPKKSQNLSGQVIKSSKRSKKRTESYALYIYKVLKTVHPDVGVSRKAMGILNSFAIDVYDRISREAANLIRWSGKKTLSAREVQTSVKLNLPGELAKHALSEGNRAIQQFANQNN